MLRLMTPDFVHIFIIFGCFYTKLPSVWTYSKMMNNAIFNLLTISMSALLLWAFSMLMLAFSAASLSC